MSRERIVQIIACGWVADDPSPANYAEAEQALEALEAMGYVVVPKEPTDAMRIAGMGADSTAIHPAIACSVYRAMITAAQSKENSHE